EKGEYVAVKEISKHDQDNLNKIFEDYLQMKPFSGRLTAEETRKLIAEGAEKLGAFSKDHMNPSEGNNTELAIVADLKKQTEKELVRVAYLAKLLGFDLSKNLQVADMPAEKAGRSPASR
ncbi:MAG: hypothetical protein HYX41_06815, partial [Bdellovibrio sp.]|nr:hypothetical protein [Bdellovibrio sp.]